MNLGRSAVFTGLACGLPVVLWTIGSLSIADSGGVQVSLIVATAMEGLMIGQACMLAAFVPWYAVRAGWAEVASGVTIFLLVPLPLYGVAWLAGAATGIPLARGLLVLALMGSVLLVVAKGVLAVCRGPLATPLAVAANQATAMIGVIATREHWLTWVGHDA